MSTWDESKYLRKMAKSWESVQNNQSWYISDVSKLKFRIKIEISVECGEGWITFDNSCYKFEPSPERKVTSLDGQSYCAQTFGVDLMVPNSRDEAVFIGSYLNSLQVTGHFFL